MTASTGNGKNKFNVKFSPGAIQRRIGKVSTPGTMADGSPAPKGGRKELAPNSSSSAHSFFKKNLKAGALTRALQGRKTP